MGYNEKKRYKSKKYANRWRCHRRPKTTSERKANQDDHDEYKPSLTRPKRKNVPNAWDDIPISRRGDKSWKEGRDSQFNVLPKPHCFELRIDNEKGYGIGIWHLIYSLKDLCERVDVQRIRQKVTQRRLKPVYKQIEVRRPNIGFDGIQRGYETIRFNGDFLYNEEVVNTYYVTKTYIIRWFTHDDTNTDVIKAIRMYAQNVATKKLKAETIEETIIKTIKRKK